MWTSLHVCALLLLTENCLKRKALIFFFNLKSNAKSFAGFLQVSVTIYVTFLETRTGHGVDMNVEAQAGARSPADRWAAGQWTQAPQQRR